MPLLSFDVETTGLDPKKNRIIEFGGVAFGDDGSVLGKVSQLIDPGVPIPPKITAITGITSKMIREEGVRWDAFSDYCKAWLDRAPVWCGQNIDFDRRFVTEEFSRQGVELEPKPFVDTLAIARRFIPVDTLRYKSLGNIASFYNVRLSRAHRAVDDAEATGRILFKLMEDVGLGLDDLISPEVVCLGHRLWGLDPFEAQFLGQAVKRG